LRQAGVPVRRINIPAARHLGTVRRTVLGLREGFA
jgi:hypothetical protein